MDIDQQHKHFQQIVERCEKTLFRKGNDYTANADRLSNFKVAGAIINIRPEMNCLSLISTKVARLGALLSSGRVPDNESISDTILDLTCYSMLLEMILIEYTQVQEPAPAGTYNPVHPDNHQSAKKSTEERLSCLLD